MFGCPDWASTGRFLFEISKAHFGDILIKVYEVQGGTAEKLFHCLLLELGFTKYSVLKY